MKRRAWAIALPLVCAFALVSCGGEGGGDGAATDEIVIGEYGSLTGSAATFGISTKNGIDMAIEEVNAAGGVLGRQVRVIVEDDQGRPEEALTVVTKLITSDRVVAVLGEVASSRTMAAAPVAQQNSIPMITPSSTNPQVTQFGDYIFRVCFIDPFQGYAMAKFASGSLGLTRVAILRDIRNDYSVGLADVFIEEFGKMGGTIVGDESYSEGDTDFNAQLTALKSTNPQAIFVPGYYTEVGLIARQARSQGITVPLLGGDGWDSSSLVEIGGEALEGSYFTNHNSPDDPRPEFAQFVANYQAKYGTRPDALAGLAYDAAKVLFAAMERAGTTDGPALRDAIAQTSNHQGVSGTITIDENRNAVKPLVVVQVSGGQFTFKEAILDPRAEQGAAAAPAAAPGAAPATPPNP
jgi:branched-chain amino acid transport system substrate-binding protein